MGLPAPPPPRPPGSQGLVGGFPPSDRVLGGLPCSPPGGVGLGAFFMGGLSLRGGGMAPGFSGMPLVNTGGRFWFLAFLGAAGLGEGDVENDRDLERLPLKELRWEEWLE